MAAATVEDLIHRVGLAKAGIERKVAAILFTYRCTIACRHCLFACRPGRPAVVMKPEQCVHHLRQLRELDRVVHIAGGEAMLYWDVLAEALRLARRHGVMPHFIESNGSFATDDAIVQERFGFLRQQGLLGILLSCDPYHQEFVPPANFLRARRIAREIFGERNVWVSDVPDEQVYDYPTIVRDESRLRELLRSNPPMLVGSACTRLSPLLEAFPIEQLPPQQGWTGGPQPAHCAAEFDLATMWEVHIDPYDNIQTNCGVILGKADRVPIRDVLAGRRSTENDVVGILSQEGPTGLAEFARRCHGFQIPQRARQKCELCYLTRRFLRPFYSDTLGPAEIYD
jgi:Radical SAM superfamily